MTCTEDFGKFKCTLWRETSIAGARGREVELEITWISCGVYQLDYTRPADAPHTDHGILVIEDWYPPNMRISFTPEQFDKAYELYDGAPRHKRDQCYKPYYEDYDLDRGMFDMERDELFQAYKDPIRDKVYLVQHCFASGTPTEYTSVLGLTIEDFKRLKEFLDSKRSLIFYSGCKIAGSPWKLLNTQDNHEEDVATVGESPG
jgi:hypothetical protein